MGLYMLFSTGGVDKNLCFLPKFPVASHEFP